MENFTSNDIMALAPEELWLKKLTGIAQMVFGLIVIAVYYKWLGQYIILIGGIGVFLYGFFIFGIQYQNVVSVKNKELFTVRGFGPIVFKNSYAASQCSEIVITSKVKREYSEISQKGGSDLYTMYYLSINLGEGKEIDFTSSKELREIIDTAQQISIAMDIPIRNFVID
jgi:hypothetical protein